MWQTTNTAKTPMGGENATMGPPTASRTPAPRGRTPARKIATPNKMLSDAEDEAGQDQLPQSQGRPLTEVGGEEVLTPLKERHGRAEEGREERGHAQPSSLPQLAGEDPDQDQQYGHERGEVQQVYRHPGGTLQTLRMHQRRQDCGDLDRDSQELTAADERGRRDATGLPLLDEVVIALSMINLLFSVCFAVDRRLTS